MKEIDVAMTDYGLTILCFFFVFVLTKYRSNSSARSWFSILFFSVGLSAALGGTVHGFIHEDTLLHTIFWRSTIVVIGISALSAWMIGRVLILNKIGQKTVRIIAFLNFGLYVLYVLFFNQRFAVAVANYLPAAIFLLIAFAKVYKQTVNRLAFFALLGLILTFWAALIQQLEIGLHDRYFNHNALYHVIQAIGLYLVFRGVRFMMRSEK